MAAEDFADFTDGLGGATDSLADFAAALDETAGSAAEADLEALGAPDVAGGEGGEVGPANLLKVAGAVAGGGGLKEIAQVLLGIASAGLPPGVGTVLTKAVGSRL